MIYRNKSLPSSSESQKINISKYLEWNQLEGDYSTPVTLMHSHENSSIDLVSVLGNSQGKKFGAYQCVNNFSQNFSEIKEQLETISEKEDLEYADHHSDQLFNHQKDKVSSQKIGSSHLRGNSLLRRFRTSYAQQNINTNKPSIKAQKKTAVPVSNSSIFKQYKNISSFLSQKNAQRRQNNNSKIKPKQQNLTTKYDKYLTKKCEKILNVTPAQPKDCSILGKQLLGGQYEGLPGTVKQFIESQKQNVKKNVKQMFNLLNVL